MILFFLPEPLIIRVCLLVCIFLLFLFLLFWVCWQHMLQPQAFYLFWVFGLVFTPLLFCVDLSPSQRRHDDESLRIRLDLIGWTPVTKMTGPIRGRTGLLQMTVAFVQGGLWCRWCVPTGLLCVCVACVSCLEPVRFVCVCLSFVFSLALAEASLIYLNPIVFGSGTSVFVTWLFIVLLYFSY